MKSLGVSSLTGALVPLTPIAKDLPQGNCFGPIFLVLVQNKLLTELTWFRYTLYDFVDNSSFISLGHINCHIQEVFPSALPILYQLLKTIHQTVPKWHPVVRINSFHHVRHGPASCPAHVLHHVMFGGKEI